MELGVPAQLDRDTLAGVVLVKVVLETLPVAVAVALVRLVLRGHRNPLTEPTVALVVPVSLPL